MLIEQDRIYNADESGDDPDMPLLKLSANGLRQVLSPPEKEPADDSGGGMKLERTGSKLKASTKRKVL